MAVRRIVIGKLTQNHPDKAIALLQCMVQRCYYAKTLAENLLFGYDKRQFVNHSMRREQPKFVLHRPRENICGSAP
jgi:hypothetical protein